MPRPDHGRRGLAPDGRHGTTGSGDPSGGWRGPGTDTEATTGHTTSPADDQPVLKTGTTLVAVATGDGAAMAADRRASLGGRFVANRDVRKVEQVHPTATLGLSGSVGAVQSLARQLRAESSLYEHRRGDPPSIDALATVASGLVRGRPVTPLLAGVDDEGGHVYELDGGGAATESRYAAAGSGMQVAYGHLESALGDDPDLPDAAETAAEAIDTASERDTASGNGVTVARITADGVETDVADAPEGIEFDEMTDDPTDEEVA